MDQKVLSVLINKKAYNKLTNFTLDIKAVKEQELGDIMSIKSPTKLNNTGSVGDDQESMDDQWGNMNNSIDGTSMRGSVRNLVGGAKNSSFSKS
jgi:hypothetical protein